MNEILGYDESNVKQKKRQEIIDNGLMIFVREGIHPVTMQNIADECSISLRSLYYYYSSKEALAVDIQIVVMDRFMHSMQYTYNDLFKAYTNIKSLLKTMVSVIKEKPNLIKYITAFDYYFFNDYPSSKYNTFLSQLKSNPDFLRLIEQAKHDQSIDFLNHPPDVFFTTMFQSLFAYAQKITYREQAMSSEDISGVGDLDLLVDMYLKALKI